jgi:hypothetical protein
LGVWNGLIQFRLFQLGKLNSKVEPSPGTDCARILRFHYIYIVLTAPFSRALDSPNFKPSLPKIGDAGHSTLRYKMQRLHFRATQAEQPAMKIILSRVGVTIDGVLDWMVGFIAPYSFTPLGTTGNYSAIADLHTLQFTVTHALGFSVFTSILATDLYQSYCHFKSHMKSSWHSLIPFLPFPAGVSSEGLTQFNSSAPEFTSWQAGVPKINSSLLDYCSILLYAAEHFFITTLHGPHAENTASIVKKEYLLIRCLEMDVLLLRTCASAGMCLPSRCLAMGIHVIIGSNKTVIRIWKEADVTHFTVLVWNSPGSWGKPRKSSIATPC